MNNDQIIKKIERGIDEAPINKMDQIKAAKVEKMAMHDHITKQSAKKLPIYKVAAIAAIFLFAFFGYRYQYVTPDTMVYLDVNPSFEIGINRAGKVVEVEGVNDDAKAVIESLSLEKLSIEEVVETITHKLVEMNYLRSDQNMILVSVYNKNEDKRIAQSDTIEKVIKIELEKDLIESVVLSQSISTNSVDDDDDNLDVSRGKLHFINTLLSMDSTLNKQDLASMSIQELVVVANRSDFSLDDYFTESEVKAIKQILFSDDDDDDDDSDDDKGTRITVDQARTIALGRVKGTIVDMDQDDDEYKFEITLEGTKYEIEIDAYTGKILKVEMDDDDDSDDDVDTTTSASQNDDDSVNGQQGPRITPEAARASALKSVNGTILKMEEEDYEFEFEIRLEGTLYKVKVHAYTGLVTKVEMDDDDDDSDDDDDQTDTDTGATPIGDDSDDDWDDDDSDDDSDDSDDDSDDQGTRITLEAAKAIALNRVKGTIVKTEQEDDKYEFEIELEGTTYQIEVHAYTGEIIKVEMEESDDDDSDDDSDEDDDSDDSEDDDDDDD